ncbi:hypothetical protein VPNG_04036 [Cytospora leucostoma]|uniref:Fe2OG dioxygenase domain-containing protein n=1 Tax=Cytospora leucostoma TaxID=1230097 RepID=A0A423XD96_9PEZI|nr:hypothetical protein VPNG_04036 [Cytospora leucostoma]
MEELAIEPHGILWQENFITPEHEEELIRVFRNELEWPDRTGRVSIHYGYTFDYKTFGVDPAIPFKAFPSWLEPLVPTHEGRPPEQVCLQHYPPGAGIPPHVDTHSTYDQLYSLSLGAPVVMQFRRGDRRVDVDLAPRSLMKMSGDARLHWTHSIKKRKTDLTTAGGDEDRGGDEDGGGRGGGGGVVVRPRGDRWSITYRWLRPGAECDCGDLDLCDTAQKRVGIEREYRWKQYEVASDNSAAAATTDAAATTTHATTTPAAPEGEGVTAGEDNSGDGVVRAMS